MTRNWIDDHKHGITKSFADERLDAIERAAEDRDEALASLDDALLSAYDSGISYREMARAAGYVSHSWIYDRIQTLLKRKP